jgi:hypothetical protein
MKGMNPMSSVVVPETVALRKRVTLTFKEFEPAKSGPPPDPKPPDPKKGVGWFRNLLKKLLLVSGVESIRHFFH